MDKVKIINMPEISAIYYALLQCSYNFYSLDKDHNLIKNIEVFRKEKCDFDTHFFKKIKQSTCEVYPYWPRAFTLEKATFHICKNSWSFIDFDSYRKFVMSAVNIAESERNEDFWSWIREFPYALQKVMTSNDFNDYLKWEDIWISQQNKLWESGLQSVQKILDICKQRYNSPVTKIYIILTPIKCSYSSDYIKKGNELYFILGSFRIESIVHEYLHHVIHNFIPKYMQFVLNHTSSYPGIDSSYYLDGDATGKLNAFEEYIVHKLTYDISNMKFPLNLDEYIKDKLTNLS